LYFLIIPAAYVLALGIVKIKAYKYNTPNSNMQVSFLFFRNTRVDSQKK